MKKILIIFVIIFSLFFVKQTVIFAEGNESDQLIQSQLNTIDISQLENSIDKMVNPDADKIFPKLNMKSLITDIATGKVSFSIKDIFNKILKYFLKEIYINLSVIIKIIVLILICSLLQNLQSAFSKEGVAEIAFYSCYILIATILIKSFLVVLGMGKEVIDSLVLFMQAFVPTIFALLISTGNITTSTVMQPSIIFSIEIASTLIKNFILPLILFYTVLAIVNNISNKVQISKLADFIKNIGTWVIGVVLTIFIAIITIQSTVTSTVDGVTTKTAKFAVSTFIPIVGKVMSDAVDTVLGYSALIKNGISIAGMLIVLAICLIPIIKLFALIFIYRLTAAMIQPVSDERIVKCISEMATSLTFILAAVVSVAVMFLISVAIVINAGNATVMMR